MNEKTSDIGNQILGKRIRILKTGLYGVDRYIDMEVPENVAFFEKLAEPGTELKLVRNAKDPRDPFRIDVYSVTGVYLGRVTRSKGQTTARLIDAGFEVIAIVNESLPFHDSDYNYGVKERPGDTGWSDASRTKTGYDLCNLPYGIYLVEE